jgi:hypothetical protein
MTTQWNNSFTNLIRQSRPTLWGNWALNPAIKVGAVGFVDSQTGDFVSIASLPSIVPSYSEFNQSWKLGSKKTSRQTGSVNLDGTYKDPTTGSTVTVGTEATWKFGSAGELASSFLVVLQGNLDNPGNQIAEQLDWLIKTAENNGYASNGAISQGFGVVTEVLWAESGVNIGANSGNSQFTLTGSVKGMTGMIDSTDAEAGLKGSYFKESDASNFDLHLWPGNPDIVADTNAPIAFGFASFAADNLIMPTWVNQVSVFTITFNNKHGGTYIVDCDVTWDLPDGTSGSNSCQVIGGQSNFVSGIPLDASNVSAKLSFKASKSLYQAWSTPLSQIPTGTAEVDIYGVWPSRPHINVHSIASS